MFNFHFKIKLFLKNKSLILALMYQRTRKTRENKRFVLIFKRFQETFKRN